MGQLVEDGLHEIDLVASQERREERVREPAQGAEGGRGTQVGVEAVVFQLLLVPEGVAFVEVPLVWDPAHHREPPRLGGEAVPRCRREDQGQGVLVQLGERRVRVTHLQPQNLDGVLPGLHHECQLRLGPLVGLGIQDNLVERLSGPEDLRLGDARLDDVHRRARRDDEGHDPEAHEKAGPRPARHRCYRPPSESGSSHRYRPPPPTLRIRGMPPSVGTYTTDPPGSSLSCSM